MKPSDLGPLYYKYNNCVSIVLLAVCDADYKFTYIHVGADGKYFKKFIFKPMHKYLH